MLQYWLILMLNEKRKTVYSMRLHFYEFWTEAKLLLDQNSGYLWRAVDSPCGSAGQESACNAGDLGSIPGLGRFPGEGKGYPLQYSDLENSMDYRPWCHKELDTTKWLSLRKIQSSFKYIFHCDPVVLHEAFLIHMQRQRYWENLCWQESRLFLTNSCSPFKT